MSGSRKGHVRVMSGSCQCHVRVLTGSCQLGIFSIVNFTRRLETEGFSVLFKIAIVHHFRVDFLNSKLYIVYVVNSKKKKMLVPWHHKHH